MYWIPIEARKPNEDDEVLAWRIGLNDVPYAMHVTAWPTNGLSRITHWTPITPPVSDEERSAALAELLSGKFAPTPDFDVRPQIPGTTDNTYRAAPPADERDALADALIAWAADEGNLEVIEDGVVICVFCAERLHPCFQHGGHDADCLHLSAKRIQERE